MLQLLLVLQLPFCGPNVINHFVCDLYPLLELACTDTYVIGLLVVANSGVICLLNFLLLAASYLVIPALLEVPQCRGGAEPSPPVGPTSRLLPCSYVPCIFIYMRPSSTLSIEAR